MEFPKNEVITAPHEHLGHPLIINDAESFERINDELRSIADGEETIALFCWCLQCNSAVTLHLTPGEQDLCLVSSKL